MLCGLCGSLQALAVRASEAQADQDSVYQRMDMLLQALANPGSSLAEVCGWAVVVSNLLCRRAPA